MSERRTSCPNRIRLNGWARRLVRLVLIVGSPYAILVLLLFLCQRSLLYFPTHLNASSRLDPWYEGDRRIGFCREVPQPETIWLMMHGNGGQAAHRDYVLSRLPQTDSLYVLEYPGYGSREGNPSRKSIDEAAVEAYRLLRATHPGVPVCLLGESLGSGPACRLAREEPPPDKIVLVVPFDSLEDVAARRFIIFPVRLLLLDRWDNVKALQGYSGPIEIYGAAHDRIIPVRHAESLARQVPGARFTRIPGGHNDWSDGDKVNLRR